MMKLLQVPEELVDVIQQMIQEYEERKKTEVEQQTTSLVSISDQEEIQAKWRKLAYKTERLSPEERKYLVDEINAVLVQVKMMENAKKLLAEKYGPAMRKLGLKSFEDLVNFLKEDN